MFQVPPDSAPLLGGVPFDTAVPVAADLKAAFDAADHAPGNRDPSRCKVLLRFPDGTVFWSAKMAIDADGPSAGPGRLSGSQMDPSDGQDDTSYHFPGTRQGLASEVVPYLVLPGGRFGEETGVQLGDVAVVVYRGRLATALAGDTGPAKKIGEGSIHLHEMLSPPAPDPCSGRDQNGSCRRVRNASIGEDVLYFVFPGSAFGEGLNQANVEAMVGQKATALFERLQEPASS